MVKIKTNARINILGNPSDIYNGVTISSTIKDFYTEGETSKADKNSYLINNEPNPNLDELVNGTLILLNREGFTINNFKFNINTNIPLQAGLAGSTAIIVNLLKGLNQIFSFNIPLKTIAYYTRVVEHDVIGNTAGPIDPFIISLGKIKYMDFSSNNYNDYIIEDLDIKDIPFFVGVRTRNISSGDIHGYPFRAYPNNPELRKIVSKIKSCGFKGKNAIVDNKLDLIGELMNENQKLTQLYGQYGKPTENVLLQRRIDQEILEFCNKNKVIGAKLGGSSGSIIILNEEKPDFLLDFKLSKKLIKIVKKLDANLIEKQISQIIKLIPAKRIR